MDRTWSEVLTKKKKKKLNFASAMIDNSSDEADRLASLEISSPNGDSNPEVCSPNSETSAKYRMNWYRNEVVRDAVMSREPLGETELEKQELESQSSSSRLTNDVKIIEEESQEEPPHEWINTKALSKYASTYELEKFEKNTMLVFNQVNVNGHEPRVGTQADVDALKKTFEKFNFEVTVHDDFTKEQIFNELKRYSSQNFTDYGCVAVAVLTHGTDNGLLRAKDQLYSEIEIINLFKVHNKPTLVTKPKLLLIQACRGTKLIPGAAVYQSAKMQKDWTLDETLEPYILPVESDMLILHSSFHGSPSIRDPLLGSWFVQELCNKIETLSATHDFESIITEMKREVAISKEFEEYNRRTLEMEVNKQMPVLTSTLIRKLFFRKYGETPRRAVTYADKRPSVSLASRSESVDSNSTPLLVQFGPCSCFLDYFVYIRSCLQHYILDHPNDEIARHYLDIANTYEDSSEFNASKQKTSKAICQYLSSKVQNCDDYKYLYFYKHS
ncbi:caspase-1-like [Anticarsia gemmatalis]|uniref:caspase-1-like n=1 Tax=Anticarsia gemmatalis TaxID=129554 RepID=UPI003F773D5E